MEYWTHEVPTPMKHSSKEEALDYLSKFITQLPPKMNKIYLDCHKEEFKGYTLQMVPSGDKELIYGELRHTNFKDEVLLDSYKIAYSHSGMPDDSKGVIKDLRDNANIVDMIGIEIREQLIELENNGDYEITNSRDIPITIETIVKRDKDGMSFNSVMIAVNDKVVYVLNPTEEKVWYQEELLDDIKYAVESYFIKSLNGKFTNDGFVDKHNLSVFLQKVLDNNYEVEINVVNKENKKPSEENET